MKWYKMLRNIRKEHCSLELRPCVLSLPYRFLLQCLEDLDASLRKLNSRLFVIRGQPTDVFPRLFKVLGREESHV